MVEDIYRVVTSREFDRGIQGRFLYRLSKGNLCREENPVDHFSVYLLIYDPDMKEVFIGHHKKSGLWLPNGGHMEKNESPLDTGVREMQEELGNEIQIVNFPDLPDFLSITEGIDNPGKSCNTHYDIWYFVEADEDRFWPDQEKIKAEFDEMRWVSLSVARKLITDPNNLQALAVLETKFEL